MKLITLGFGKEEIVNLNCKEVTFYMQELKSSFFIKPLQIKFNKKIKKINFKIRVRNENL